MSKKITVTHEDRQRLGTMLLLEQTQGAERREYLDSLENELEIARAADPDKVPHDVVTMDSVVDLRDLKSGEAETYTLVFPERADIHRNRISVLAPMGTAILGRREGDIVKVNTPSGVRCIRIEAVIFQPENSSKHKTNARIGGRHRSSRFAASDAV